MTLKIQALFLAPLLLALSVFGKKPLQLHQQHEQRQLQDATIAEIATDSDDLGTLVTALTAAGLVPALQGAGPFTVWAPTDQAFVEADIDFLLNPEWLLHLQAILLYHVAEGTFFTDDLQVGEEINTLSQDEAINVTGLDPMVINGNATAIMPNITASNGVVHVIDEVLFPEFTELSVVDLAAGIPDTFSTLVELLTLANLTEVLGSDTGVYTVFAPTNEAFAQLEPDTLAFLTSDEGAQALEDILLYHVVSGIAYLNGVSAGDTAATLLEGANVTVTQVGDDGVVLNGVANIVSGDVLARNGVIHVLDSVLAPPDVATGNETETEVPPEVDPVVPGTDTTTNVTVPPTPPTDGEATMDLEMWVFQNEESYSTLYALLNLTGLTEQLSGTNELTLFAPDDAAFAALPDSEKYLEPEWYAHLYDILLYHIVPGDLYAENMTEDLVVFSTLGENFTVTSIDPTVVINNISTVVDPNNEATNGVAHGIDSVLLPPSAVFDLVDIIEASPFFEELLGLIVAAGLDEALRDEGPYTIFAPTNNAINGLDPDTVALLTSEEGLPQLQDILRYHIVSGTILLSDEIESGDMAATLQGSMINLTEDGGTYFVNGAEVVDSDVLGSNGVIHVINQVLLPPPDDDTEMPPVEDMATTVPEGTDAPETDAPEPVDPVVTGAPTDSPVAVEPETPVDPVPDEVASETNPTDTDGTDMDSATAAPTESPAVFEQTTLRPTSTPSAPADDGGTTTEVPQTISSASARHVVSAIACAFMLPFLLAG